MVVWVGLLSAMVWAAPEDKVTLAHLRAKASAGDVAAMTKLGDLYRGGSAGVKRDATTALGWYRKAAAKGGGEAMFAIGQMHAHGDGVKRDNGKALAWAIRAADAGYPLSMHRVGKALITGDGVKAQPDKGMRYLMQAAQAGYGPALFDLGLMYAQGHGVKPNASRGLRLMFRPWHAWG